jgi:hypothetical protein
LLLDAAAARKERILAGARSLLPPDVEVAAHRRWAIRI